MAASSGVRTPFYLILVGDVDLTPLTNNFSYKYSEKDHDKCDVTLITNDVNFVDKPYFIERTMYTVSWGYQEEPDTVATRKVWLLEADYSYDRNWVQIKLTLSEKAALMSQGSSQVVHQKTTMIEVAKKIGDKNGVKVKLEPDTSSTLSKVSKILGNFQEIVKTGVQMQAKIDSTTKDLRLQVLQNKQPHLLKGRGFFEDQIALKKFYEENNPWYIEWTNKFIEMNKGWAYRDKDRIKGALPKPSEGTDPASLMNGSISQQAALANPEQYRAYLDSLDGQLGGHNRSVLMRYYEYLPQGGKSDFSFVKEMGMREHTGGNPYLIKTRDDEMIIKQRNFNQKPKRLYNYGDNVGIVKSFSPYSVKKHKKANSNMQYGGWNRNSKEYVGGQINYSDPSVTHLTNYIDAKMALNKAIQNNTFADFRISDFIGGAEPSRKRGMHIAQDFHQNTDQTRVVVKDPIPMLPQDMMRGIDAVIDEFAGKVFPSFGGAGPQDAYEHANNFRAENELSKNPGRLKIEGDALLEDGFIFTMKGVAKKHSGNYYVVETTHTIDKAGGYETELSFVRTGHNAPTSVDSVQSEEATDQDVNVQEGEESYTNQKILPNASNETTQ